MNVIVFGAHPDDCELQVGGTGALLARKGHKVKFVSVTNGDAGHQDMGGGELARVRKAEAAAADKILGVTSVVLDNHDGELVPTLEVRKQLIREIRTWDADVVITHRPNDYHPDHRNTALAVQDTAYMVIVPNVCPDVPPLKKNPVYLYTRDHFKTPEPFRPDIIVPIDDVYEQKICALHAMSSQFYEWLPWTNNALDSVPKSDSERRAWLAKIMNGSYANPYAQETAAFLGGDRARSVRLIEAFQLCEYGRQPSKDELRKMFAV